MVRCSIAGFGLLPKNSNFWCNISSVFDDIILKEHACGVLFPLLIWRWIATLFGEKRPFVKAFGKFPNFYYKLLKTEVIFYQKNKKRKEKTGVISFRNGPSKALPSFENTCTNECSGHVFSFLNKKAFSHFQLLYKEKENTRYGE